MRENAPVVKHTCFRLLASRIECNLASRFSSSTHSASVNLAIRARVAGRELTSTSQSDHGSGGKQKQTTTRRRLTLPMRAIRDLAYLVEHRIDPSTTMVPGTVTCHPMPQTLQSGQAMHLAMQQNQPKV
jgi:hypothetical protein